MIAGASLAFWLIVTFLFIARIALSVYNWWTMKRLGSRLEEIEQKS